MTSTSAANGARPQLGLWDTVSIIIGIVIGASIFKVPNTVFSNTDTAWGGLGAWALGGLLALIGALVYAELATTYPRSGGDYVYLTRAYGPLVGFLFGWAQLAAIFTGSIGAMAFAFSAYTVALVLPRGTAPEEVQRVTIDHGAWIAAAAVVAISLVNLFGLAFGKTTQNLLTAAKVLGLGGVVVVAVLFGGNAAAAGAVENTGNSTAQFGVAMVVVLYAYGGWNDAAFVAAEVRDRKRNLPLALLLGTGGVMLVYLLVNAAYVWALGLEGVRASKTPAADVLGLVHADFGNFGQKGMSLLVMVSALGAVNGLVLTGSRIYSSMGAEHRLLAVLGRWHPRTQVPVWSILAQMGMTLLLVLLVGTSGGQGLIEGAFGRPVPWKRFDDGFEMLVATTAPVFWTFFLLTGISLVVLRWKDPRLERPFATPLYPVVPLVFCSTCVYMFYQSVKWAGELAVLGLVPVLLGVPLYWISRRLPAAEKL